MFALAFPVYLGVVQSWSFATSWPNAKAFIAVFRPLADHSTGPMLVEDPSIAKYYLPSGQRVAALVQHPQHRLVLRGQHRDHHRHHLSG